MDGHGQNEGESSPASTSTSTSTSTIQIQNQWREIQDLLKERLITEDDFPWKLPISSSSGDVVENEKESLLKYVGGADVSYSKDLDSAAACGCGSLVVLDLTTLQVVYQDFSILTDFHLPYIPAFLAFREAPILLQLLQKMKNTGNPFYPQLLLVDGNGLLHPRGFGLACHLGVLANIPTIGIGKNLHHVDGLTQSGVRQLLQAKDNSADDFIALTGSSGCIWGAAMRSTKGSLKPIYISVGHRVSLDTAIKIVKLVCKYRVPEPIRQADIRSRDYLQKNNMGMLEHCNCSNLMASMRYINEHKQSMWILQSRGESHEIYLRAPATPYTFCSSDS